MPPFRRELGEGAGGCAGRPDAVDENREGAFHSVQTACSERLELPEQYVNSPQYVPAARRACGECAYHDGVSEDSAHDEQSSAACAESRWGRFSLG
jgi:hypothetical protein